MRFHDLRHTCPTLLLSKNVNPKVVPEMLGHCTIGITLDIYSYVLPNLQKGTAKAKKMRFLRGCVRSPAKLSAPRR